VLQHLEAGGDLAEQDDTSGYGRTLEEHFTVRNRCYLGTRILRYPTLE
jgi:hypothetical protein